MKDKQQKNFSRRGILKNNFWLLKQIWKYTPGYVICMITEGIIWGIHHSIGIIYVQKLFDALGRHTEFGSVAKVILNYAIYMILFFIFHFWYWELYNPRMREKLHIAIHSEMFKQAIRMDLIKYDDPVFFNDFIWAMEKSYSHSIGLMEDTGKLISRIVASFTLTGVLFNIDITMAVIILELSVIRIGLTFIINKVNLKYTDTLNPLERKINYVKRVFKLSDYAKDLRITHIAENLFEMHKDATEEKKKVVGVYGKKFAALNFFRNTIAIIGESGLFILMLYKVMVTGELGLGSFAIAINACWKMSWLLRDMVDRLLKYHEHGIFIEKMIAFLHYEPNIVSGTHEATQFETLIIRNLKFSYVEDNGQKQINALDGVNMEIHRGEKIAIVGYNGSGKTTLTKLIMRLYDTTEGEILYNGKNIKKYTISSLRKRMAAVFQDHRIFACSLAENVVGGLYEESMDVNIYHALCKSTFADKLATLPNGIQTQMTREFDNSGIQLSGGEQQKIAIARALYKNADLIILDEPSSALDPDAEYELDQVISKYENTKTIIYISHRLSTTRHADKIYMFDNGKLIESGTHEELMTENGKYAYMFNLQAEKYRKQF